LCVFRLADCGTTCRSAFIDDHPRGFSIFVIVPESSPERNRAEIAKQGRRIEDLDRAVMCRAPPDNRRKMIERRILDLVDAQDGVETKQRSAPSCVNSTSSMVVRNPTRLLGNGKNLILGGRR